MAEQVQRRMSQYMASRSKSTNVSSGLLEGVRDWRSWLEPLDQIRSKQGIEMITHAHWFAWTTRADLPMEWATLGPAPSAEAQPKDVMMVVKEFMSDLNLMQPPVLMLSAGASAMLQPLAGPSAWDYREDIDVAAIERLCTKVVNTCPSRASVVPYLKQWVAQPRVPAMPVPHTTTFQYQCRDGPTLGLPQDLKRSLEPTEQDVAIRPVVVKRRKRNQADWELCEKMTLENYVATRTTQGVNPEIAVQEWNGSIALLWPERDV